MTPECKGERKLYWYLKVWVFGIICGVLCCSRDSFGGRRVFLHTRDPLHHSFPSATQVARVHVRFEESGEGQMAGRGREKVRVIHPSEEWAGRENNQPFAGTYKVHLSVPQGAGITLKTHLWPTFLLSPSQPIITTNMERVGQATSRTGYPASPAFPLPRTQPQRQADRQAAPRPTPTRRSSPWHQSFRASLKAIELSIISEWRRVASVTVRGA